MSAEADLSSKSSRSALLLLKVFPFPPFLLLMTMMANIEIIARIITTGTMLEDNSPDPKNPPDSVVESVDFGV